MPNIELPGEFPERLRAFRSSRHLSESDLAEKAGLTYKTIHALEAGKRLRVMERTVLSLAAALDLTVDELLGQEPVTTDQGVTGYGYGTPPASRLSNGRILALAGALALVLVLGFGGAFLYGRAHAEWTVEKHALSARDAVFGIKLWETHNNAEWRMAEDSPWDRGHLLVGTGSTTPDGGKLLCLERATGDTVWTVGPDVAAVVRAFGTEIVGAASFSCGGFETADTDGDGEPELVVRFVHGLYYPCCLCLVDRDGNLLNQYANRGHFYDFLTEDVDRDGRDEVVVCGTNNAPAYQGFTVVKLDRENWSGASVDSACNPESSESDGSAHRVVVPAYPQPYMDVLGKLRLQGDRLDLVRDDEGRPRYTLRVSGGAPHVMQVVLDENLRPLLATPTDGFIGHMTSQWADSLTDGTGPVDPRWCDAWLARGARFERGKSVRLR